MKLDPERVAGIMALPPPRTKREVRQLLGLLGDCRQWIESYSEKVKFLCEKLTTDQIKWTQKDEEEFRRIKGALTEALVLSLPDVRKPFQLFVDASNHMAHGVLTQDWAGVRKPVGYLSRLFGLGQQGLAHLSASSCGSGFASGGSKEGDLWGTSGSICTAQRAGHTTAESGQMAQ